MSTLPPPPPPSWNTPAPATPPRRDGKLMASGIMMLIQAAFTLIMGLWFLTLSQSDSAEWFDDATGGTITFVGLVVTAIGGGLLWTGVGAVRGRRWARITTIVLQSIFLVPVLLAMVDNPAPGAIVPIAWAGTILGLAIAGKPS